MKRILYKIITLSITISLLNCANKEKSVIKETTTTKETKNVIEVTKAQFKNSKMVLGTLEEKLFPTIIRANGIVDVPPENKAIINAKMGGYIKKTPLLVGDKVTKGQALVTIENPEFITLQQNYMEIKGQLSYLKSNFQRQKTMFSEKITSQKSFLKAESDYKTAIAKYNGLEKQLKILNISTKNVANGNFTSETTIYAPISGSITKINVNRGSYVSPASIIMEIVDNSHIHLELSVFEKDILKIKKNQKINFKIPEASNNIFNAEVHLIGTALENNRTIKIHAHLENESHNNFLIGMFVEAEIIIDNILEKSLPNETIVMIDETPYVLILHKEDKEKYYFEQKEVILKESYGKYMIIKNADTFLPKTQFLTKGAYNLLGE
ncbi:efflux RND transporter periplasmic adaptor subunit [Polaribacter sp. MSW13]|uniref:Efflux RND transporter periplasmic adaptor subunit n=1 Tax=Polaribacter marinus TaxID=2916838 RepID=A0A9X1VQK0_9FLAO|nr:efflux RND transporter periplasmic adaptor subunit [Polaribacter marinus]MCI2228865.1 efflux RND transporter periplasmic adaptor subunit [Polaribacter marinus]